MSDTVLSVRDLKVHFPLGGGLFQRSAGTVRAVDGVSFSLKRGECLGIVGESGCGKSTMGLAVMRLLEPTSGEVRLDDVEVQTLYRRDRRAFARQIQMVFQDPYSSLNPRMTIARSLDEPLRLHGVSSAKERADRIAYVLEKVGLRPDQAKRYPHEFSGGQRQRVGIARALILKPSVIIGDEPVSALDVSIRAQIINLLVELQAEFKLSYIIISHDLAVVEHLCDRIAVMYLGQIVEIGSYRDIYNNPQHPYTKALLSAVPSTDPALRRQRIVLHSDIPSPLNPPRGCRFHTRCGLREDGCTTTVPELRSFGAEHFAACHLAGVQ
ncbi:ABC transporter ATP-binding protein [Bosea sp. 2YAB26]|uniref:ABC transporter ATP-binding protein n=1 Tax=Bosea sp. 2YAB26 TaxID=3237478 RepID=UPI003F917108